MKEEDFHLRTGNREQGTGNREQGTGNREIKKTRKTRKTREKLLNQCLTAPY
jgi:hypothetical protein